MQIKREARNREPPLAKAEVTVILVPILPYKSTLCNINLAIAKVS